MLLHLQNASFSINSFMPTFILTVSFNELKVCMDEFIDETVVCERIKVVYLMNISLKR